MSEAAAGACPGTDDNQLDLPLNLKERAQWMLHRLTPGQGICNLADALAVDRQLRWWPLQEALNHLLRRHRALRGTLRLSGATPRKFYLPEDTEFPFETRAATEDTVDDVLADVAAMPFDLDGAPLVRACLVMTPTGSVLCLVLHHLVGDHISFTVVLDELATLYDTYAAGAAVPERLVGPAPILVEGDPDPAVVDYWVQHLRGADPARMALAGARTIPGRPTFAGGIVDHMLSAEADAAVAALRRRTRLTANIVLLTAYFALLAKHGAGPDLVVGVPVNGRRAAHRDAVGFHVNTLPIRVHVDPAVDMAEFSRRVSGAFLLGLENSAASFEAVQFRLDARSGDWRAPLFRHMFNFRPIVDSPKVGDDSLRPRELRCTTSRLDVELEVRQRPSGTQILARFSTEVHDENEIATLLRRFDALLVAMADAPADTPVGQVAGWTAEDERLVADLNNTANTEPASRRPVGTVLDWIIQRAVESPDATAISAGGPGAAELSYAGLTAWAGQIASSLRRSGVQPGNVVGVHAGRGAELAAAVLGVWGAGAAYLVLDPQHPVARLGDQLQDAAVHVLLSAGPVADELTFGRTCLDISAIRGTTPTPEPTGGPGWSGDAVAYVCYTSGSTGRPKGVEVTHDSLANLIAHFVAALPITADDRMLWLTTYSFDISALELFGPLAAGAAVIVADDEIRLRPSALVDLAEAAGVTMMQATPTTWRFLADKLTGRLPGITALTGGEAISSRLAERLLADGRSVLNVYGPTETTIWSTSARLSSPVPEPVPIGRPITATAVHVLDRLGNPAPPGVPGELCIGGAGVARGYRGRPELTAMQFRDDPRLGRYYRTGDLVRLGFDGLEFLGRLDRQVKVRGHRIELTEVERILGEDPDVKDVVVTVEADRSGEALLAAAIRSDLSGEAARALVERLAAAAATRLPAASAPARYTVVDAFPLTGNGKVDHRALAARMDGGEGTDALPEDQLVATLVLAWRAVLGSERLGADANFFLCGGHSLLAAQLAARLSATLGRPLDFDAIFLAPTPHRLAERLRRDEP
jgi:amino acid adenylation domain-containing protein